MRDEQLCVQGTRSRRPELRYSLPRCTADTSSQVLLGVMEKRADE